MLGLPRYFYVKSLFRIHQSTSIKASVSHISSSLSPLSFSLFVSVYLSFSLCLLSLFLFLRMPVSVSILLFHKRIPSSLFRTPSRHLPLIFMLSHLYPWSFIIHLYTIHYLVLFYLTFSPL